MELIYVLTEKRKISHYLEALVAFPQRAIFTMTCYINQTRPLIPSNKKRNVKILWLPFPSCPVLTMTYLTDTFSLYFTPLIHKGDWFPHMTVISSSCKRLKKKDPIMTNLLLTTYFTFCTANWNKHAIFLPLFIIAVKLSTHHYNVQYLLTISSSPIFSTANLTNYSVLYFLPFISMGQLSIITFRLSTT